MEDWREIAVFGHRQTDLDYLGFGQILGQELQLWTRSRQLRGFERCCKNMAAANHGEILFHTMLHLDLKQIWYDPWEVTFNKAFEVLLPCSAAALEGLGV